MDIPLELSFHNLEPSDALKQAVQGHVDKLEQYHDHIIGCRVVIEIPNKSLKATGNPPDVHIVIRVPGKEIVVSREYKDNGHKKAATDAYAVLDDCFATAQKQLKDWRRISHGDVKYKSGEPRGTSGESGLEA
jgi:ribosome-associated translation inhibitor RaiA